MIINVQYTKVKKPSLHILYHIAKNTAIQFSTEFTKPQVHTQEVESNSKRL
jgi:hypothetical protein